IFAVDAVKPDASATLHDQIVGNHEVEKRIEGRMVSAGISSRRPDVATKDVCRTAVDWPGNSRLRGHTRRAAFLQSSRNDHRTVDDRKTSGNDQRLSGNSTALNEVTPHLIVITFDTRRGELFFNILGDRRCNAEFVSVLAVWESFAFLIGKGKFRSTSFELSAIDLSVGSRDRKC